MASGPHLLGLMIGPRIASFLSFVGSSYIIYKVLTSPLRRSRVHHRLLAGMSIYDLFSSTAYFISSWAAPKGTPGMNSAMGNTATCTALGYFSNFVIGNALYNTSLSIYFWLSIRHQLTSKRLLKIERVMHAIPFVYAVIGGVLIAAVKSFNFAGRGCWVAQVPLGCKGDDCVRGKRAFLIQWVIMAIVVICIIVSTICMIGICWAVFKQNSSMAKRSSTLDTTGNITRKQKLRDIFTQAMLYLGAFYVTWLFSIATRLYIFKHGHHNSTLHLFAQIVHPLQGALNVLVYMRKEFFSSCWIDSFRQIIRHPCKKSATLASYKDELKEDTILNKGNEYLEDEIESTSELVSSEHTNNRDTSNPQSV